MEGGSSPGRIGGAIAGILLALTGSLLGAALGMLWVRLFVPRKQMGWDQIADALGGLMGGSLLGLLLGAVLAIFLSQRARLIGAAISTLAAAGILGGLAATRPPREVSQPVSIRKAFEPAFSAAVRVSHSDEILLAVPADERPLPFTEGKVWTVGPEVVRVGWGPELTQCSAEPTEADLESMVPLVRAAMAEAGEPCRTEAESDLLLSFALRLGEERASASLEAGCLAERPAFAALAAGIADVIQRLEPRFRC